MNSELLDNVFIGSQEALGLINHPSQEEEQINDVDGECPASDHEGDFPMVEAESDSSGGEETDAEDRIRIRPSGDLFSNPNQVLSEAHSIIQALFTGAWISWRKVPRERKEVWFKEFMKKFFWKDKHSESVRRNWSGKCSQFLRWTFSNARKEKKKPAWIALTIWSEMLKFWESEDYKELSATNKSHRACLRGSYTGGSRNIRQHVKKYEEEYKKKMSQGELMRKVYRKKRTKTWTGTKMPDIIERYNELITLFKESHPEEMTEEDKCRLWAEAGGTNSKGQVYGLGSLKKVPSFRNPGSFSSQALTRNVDGNQLEEFRKLIEEDLRRSITEEVKKTTDETIQQLVMYNREQEARHLQIQRAQQIQIQTLVQTFQQVPCMDPLQANTPFSALLNSQNPPLASSTVLLDSLLNTTGYMPQIPFPLIQRIKLHLAGTISCLFAL